MINCQGIQCRSAIQKRWDKSKKVFHIRFWNKIKIGALGECWEYPKQGSRRYPSITIDNQKTCPAHRVAYELFHGEEIPEGMLVCHHCDNPPCCNPYHLFLGTPKDNTQDMVRKGRNPDIRGDKNPMYGVTGESHPSFGKPGKHCGERHHLCKLTEEKVKEIRTKFYSGAFTKKVIAKEYGVHPHSIYLICSRKIWKHVI